MDLHVLLLSMGTSRHEIKREPILERRWIGLSVKVIFEKYFVWIIKKRIPEPSEPTLTSNISIILLEFGRQFIIGRSRFSRKIRLRQSFSIVVL